MTGQQLARVVGVPGAVMMGLGSILGTGIFVSIGIGAGVAGAAVLPAIVIAAFVATCNGLSSAQLAASHPVSGGTYEYGYRYLTPALGFTAGWMFLCAKSASAATAALGMAGYLLHALARTDATWRVALGATAIVVLTVVVAAGMRRSNRVNIAIVSVTLLALLAFAGVGMSDAVAGASEHLQGAFAFDGESLLELLHATALMFVAYTGYGRVATLGEEIREPARSIPRAIICTLFATMAIYALVAFVAVSGSGAPTLAAATESAAAPLQVVADSFDTPWVVTLVGVGAITAMLGVLLNLLLGLSRVVLAMARRGDLPRALAHVHGSEQSPRRAVVAVGAFVLAIALVGSVRLTWSFSAFTVLVYYALTNLAALRLPVEHRMFGRWVSVAGLLSCLSLAFFVEPRIWLVGVGLIAAGLLWRKVARMVGAERGDA